MSTNNKRPMIQEGSADSDNVAPKKYKGSPEEDEEIVCYMPGSDSQLTEDVAYQTIFKVLHNFEYLEDWRHILFLLKSHPSLFDKL